MSGIVGIINLDGAPVNRDVLQQMSKFMVNRWPDALNIWISGHVGFAHALLHTSPESQREQQPWSRDSQVWIIADARIDGRPDLIQELKSKGLSDLEVATDVELILYAYQIWDEDCVKHLIGDFAFAIWDGRRKSLFCARDHFGVRPFYYVQSATRVLFASDIDSLRSHPDVSSTLNELAVGDFMIFGGNQDETATIFRQIWRIPPAHCLIVTKDKVEAKRYWTLPTNGYMRYQNSADYIAHYRKIFSMAVEDRLRTDRVAILMSGGTDSTAVAAVAYQCLKKSNRPADLRACTVGVRNFLPNDPEGYFAGLTAETLGFPIDYLDTDTYRLYEGWDRPELRCQQPVNHAMLASWYDCYFLCARHSPVVLTGYGGDAVMAGSKSYYTELLRRGRLFQFLVSASQHVYKHRSLRGLGFRSALKRLLGLDTHWLDYPPWINSQFETRVGLRERYEVSTRKAKPEHDSHPDAYAALESPFWSELFEFDFPASVPLEVRHPFFDVRLITFLLAIPPIPWCRNKTIHREAMRGILPEAVQNRSKTPVLEDWVLTRLNHPTRPQVLDTSLEVVGEKYVDRAVYQNSLEQYKKGDICNYYYTAPINLEYWLRTQISCN